MGSVSVLHRPAKFAFELSARIHATNIRALANECSTFLVLFYADFELSLSDLFWGRAGAGHD
jgi:hypothetical protein